jgi:putative endonuclease
MFYVYILKSTINKDLYIGYSEDLKRRLMEHNSGNVRATKPNRPWILIYYEAYKDKRDASKREKHLKMHRVKEDMRIQIAYSMLN